MLATENFCFAFVLLTNFVFNLLSELLAGRLQVMRQEYEATLATGVPTDSLLSLFETEVSVETFVSIGITAYAFPFCNTSAASMLGAVLSIGLACWNLGSFVYEQYDLPMPVDMGKTAEE